ncbi:MAG: chemotaxis protein CheW [Pseudomonadota bacterium]
MLELSGTLAIFKAADKLYGAPAELVREVVHLPEVSPLEDAADFLIGVVNVRGRVVPVVDLCLRLGRKPVRYSPTDSLVILEFKRRLVGLIVNELVEISHFEPGRIDLIADLAETGAAGGLGESRCLAGVAKDEDRLIRVLDVAALLGQDDLEPPPGPGSDSDPAPQPRAAAEARCFLPGAGPGELAVFRERANRLRRPLGEKQEEGRLALAVVGLGEELLGVELEIVRGFAAVRRLTPIPGCPGHVLGDVNLRGEILTVLDLGVVLNLQVTAVPANPRLMVVECRGIRVGFQVDDVIDIIHLDPDRISPSPLAGAAARRDYYKGAAVFRDRAIGILDLPRLLADGRLVVDQQI